MLDRHELLKQILLKCEYKINKLLNIRPLDIFLYFTLFTRKNYINRIRKIYFMPHTHLNKFSYSIFQHRLQKVLHKYICGTYLFDFERERDRAKKKLFVTLCTHNINFSIYSFFNTLYPKVYMYIYTIKLPLVSIFNALFLLLLNFYKIEVYIYNMYIKSLTLSSKPMTKRARIVFSAR